MVSLHASTRLPSGCQPSRFLGLLLAMGWIPASWAIGSGKYALLLGVNAWGFLLCSAGFFLPLLARLVAVRAGEAL